MVVTLLAVVSTSVAAVAVATVVALLHEKHSIANFNSKRDRLVKALDF